MSLSAPVYQIHEWLVEYTGLPLRVDREGEPRPAGAWDVVFEGPGVTFLIQYRRIAGAESVGSALRRITQSASRKPRCIPLLVVPFMGEVGKALCKQAGVAWLDLSGNASIATPRLRVSIEGKPNRYARKGRPSDPFAPKASRITRILLTNPESTLSQGDVVFLTGLDKGFVSRLLKRLEAAGFVERVGRSGVRVSDPARVLSAWRAGYDFERHQVIKAVVAARSGPELLQRAASRLRETPLRFAATGLAAAWAYAPFSAYRTATLYVDQPPSGAMMKLLGARETGAGANLWLVVPNDTGVFTGSRRVDGIEVVSPLQAYLDLAAQPERAEEAAEELRRVHLPWADE